MMADSGQTGQNKIRRAILAALCAIAMVSLLAYYFHFTRTTINTQKQLLKAEARKAAADIDGWLQKLAEVGDRLALRLGRTDVQDVEAAIRDEVRHNPEVFGVGAAFIPYAHDKTRKLYAPYYVRRGKVHQLIFVEDKYDYTDGTRAWYELPIRQKKPVWQEPYFGPASDSYLAEYTVPIVRSDDAGQERIVGVVYVNYSLDDIRSFMSSLNIGKTGYGAILSSNGAVLYHPYREMVTLRQTVFDIARKHESKDLLRISKNAAAGHSGVEDYKSIFSGQKMWFFYEPITVAGWSLNILAVKDELPLNIDLQRRLIFGASAAAMLLMLCLAGFNADRWRAAILASLVLVAGTVVIWIIVESDKFKTDGQSYKMVDKASLNKFMDQYTRKCRKITASQDPVFIPTGLFIQSIRFAGANNVVVTGYIWQDYGGLDSEIRKGVIFPEAEDCQFKEAYVKEDTIGWYFKANLREQFDYSEYPFDREQVWLRVWHKDFNRNVVLIPDLDSYQFINPTSKPGIEEDFVLTGWKIQKSFFNFRFNPYNSNFGIKSFGQNKFPELYFNVTLKRSFLNPFVAHLIPLFVVILILYFILMVQIKEDADGLFGFNSLSAVLGCSALFFVVIFNHIAIRDSLAASRIVYLEIFYFVTYLSILFVSANAFLVARFDNYNNDRSKRFFFPTILGVLYGLTFIEFF